jgi:hypothetical protein
VISYLCCHFVIFQIFLHHWRWVSLIMKWSIPLHRVWSSRFWQRFEGRMGNRFMVLSAESTTHGNRIESTHTSGGSWKLKSAGLYHLSWDQATPAILGWTALCTIFQRLMRSGWILFTLEKNNWLNLNCPQCSLNAPPGRARESSCLFTPEEIFAN